MFRREDFGKCEAQDKLAELKGKYTLGGGLSSKEVQEQIDKVMFATKIYTDAPAYILSKTLYDDEDGVFVSARFKIRPSAKSALFINDVKKTFVINACENFFDKLIDEVGVWFDTYTEYAKLDYNLSVLNAEVEEIRAKNELPTQVKFTLGSGIMDIDTNSVVVGISEDVIKKIPTLSVFDSIIEVKKENYKNTIADTLIECAKPYDIVKIKNPFTKDLELYSRRGIAKLLREIVNRNLSYVRTGVGYYEDDTIFAVVEKEAIKEGTEVGEDVVVLDNTTISNAEAKKGLTKLAVRYKVKPFVKETGELVDLDIALILG